MNVSVVVVNVSVAVAIHKAYHQGLPDDEVMLPSYVESLAALWRADPAEALFLTVVPVVLAVAQVATGLFTDAPLVLTLSFAGTLLAVSVVAAGHSAASWRRRRVDRLAFGQGD